MKQLITSFPDQLLEALEIGRSISWKLDTSGIQNVYIVGMGGSGIGGDFVSAYARSRSRVPVQVGKSYEVPAWVDPNTLAITSSYSGNTEETLTALDQMLKAGVQVVGVTSGGQMKEKLEAAGKHCVEIPSGIPAPRACLGYSLVLQLYVLARAGLVPDDFAGEVEVAAQLLQTGQEDIMERAHRMAQIINGKTSVIYTTGLFEPVALRFRQQLAENSKNLAWHHTIPEMNHNEVVGWHGDHPELIVFMLRSKLEYSRNQLRMDYVKELAGHFASGLVVVNARGNTYLEQALYLVHLLDWVSFYLAEIKGVDVMAIRAIDHLKQLLSEK